jgi:Histidine kinase-, DNA gyrase B-, and HSP90-like ATPase
MSSLRGVGYSLETAIADIVDNSIAAGAARIEIGLTWKRGDDAVVTILDNGSGMSEDRLVEAMRFGGKGPMVERASTDLGRFGLGLKTASLSQCRQLTVASKIGGSLSAFTWDVDLIAEGDGGWHLLEGTSNVPKAALAILRSHKTGTLVVWQKIDFGRLDDRPDAAAVLGDVDRLDRHLSMVFHRFIRGDARRIEITINGNTVEAWDPFLESHEATIPQPTQNIRSPGGPVVVRGFVLPHRDRFRTESEFETAGGPEGWNAQQGFYVYRNRRLLCAGGWLGLGGTRTWTREEPSRLARVRIDIPNTADRDWRIDIRKAIARPPDAIRKRLQVIAEDLRRKAREVFVHRGLFGVRTKDSKVSRIWHVNPDGAARRYTIRRDHELIRLLKDRLGKTGELLESTLDLIERTVPVERVWLDVTERGTPAVQLDDNAETIAAAATLVDLLAQAGVPFETAVANVAMMDPFDKVPDLPKKLAGAKKRGARR